MLKHSINRLIGGALGLVAAGVLTGCADKWDDHYSGVRPGASESTVYELIKADPELSVFGEMIDASGYAGLLNTSQTFTVWAPDNAALSDVDLDDEDEVKRIVANHICRFNVSSATSQDKGVRMYNGKMLYFEGNTFGGVAMLRSDILASNGIMHRLSGRIPYAYNIREYIDTHSETSDLAAFLKRFDELKFDELLSAPIDIDENGATVYDSVKVSYNRVFQHPVYGLGDIASEDSVFTMIVADNGAWRMAYDRISPLFKVYDTDKRRADSISDVQTSLAIIQDLMFRARITDPVSMSGGVATSGSEIADMGSMFSGTERINASNGMIYLAGNINYDPLCTYNKAIRVEAENPSGRVKGVGTSIYTRVIATDSQFAPMISEGSYVEVSASSVSRQPSVTYEIPNTLSGRYDIYATFVPAMAEDVAYEGERTRVKFTLSYQGEDGKTKSAVFDSADYLTSGSGVMTMKVAEGVELPVSNFYDRLWLMEEGNDASMQVCTTKLFIQTNVSNTEFNNNELKRRFFIDSVELVPSK